MSRYRSVFSIFATIVVTAPALAIDETFVARASRPGVKQPFLLGTAAPEALL